MEHAFVLLIPKLVRTHIVSDISSSMHAFKVNRVFNFVYLFVCGCVGVCVHDEDDADILECAELF